MFDLLFGLGNRDVDADPGVLWKLGQVALMILSVAAAFVVFAYIGGFD